MECGAPHPRDRACHLGLTTAAGLRAGRLSLSRLPDAARPAGSVRLKRSLTPGQNSRKVVRGLRAAFATTPLDHHEHACVGTKASDAVVTVLALSVASESGSLARRSSRLRQELGRVIRLMLAPRRGG